MAWTFAGAALLVLACMPPDGGAALPVESSVVDVRPGDGGGESTRPSLQVIVARPFCCNALERTFSAFLNGASLPAGSSCVWEFGDGHSANGCNVSHSFRWAGEYIVVLHVTLPGDDDTLSSELRLQVESLTVTATETLYASVGPDLEAAPGERVQLHADLTVVPPHAPVAVLWRQMSGPSVALNTETSLSPSFVMPEVEPGARLVFEFSASSERLFFVTWLSVSMAAPIDTVWVDCMQSRCDPDDATYAVQEAIDSGAATVVIPQTGSPWVVRPIFLRSNLKLVLEPGVVVEAKPGAYPNSTDSVFSAIDVENVTIEANRATIRMPRDEYVEPFSYPGYVAGEWRHAVRLQGARGVQVLGLHVDGTGGDGIYIGPGLDGRRAPCSNVVVRDCHIDRSYRNGMSIVSGQDILIDNCTITGTEGTAPRAGIDVEPDDSMDLAVDIEIRNCVAIGNAGTGFFTNLSELNAGSQPVSVRFIDCVVRNATPPGLRAVLRDAADPSGVVEFANCVVEGTGYAGAMAVWDTAAAIQLRFAGCKWRDVARNGRVAPLQFELVHSGSVGPSGGIEFIDCVLYDSKDREPFQVVSSDWPDDVLNVFGEIDIVNPLRGELGPTLAPSCPELVLDYMTDVDQP